MSLSLRLIRPPELMACLLMVVGGASCEATPDPDNGPTPGRQTSPGCQVLLTAVEDLRVDLEAASGDPLEERLKDAYQRVLSTASEEGCFLP